MQVHTFIAESAVDAVAQIRAQLGPQAVVLNVRPLPSEGLSRLWQKSRIEVLACLPEVPAPAPGASADALAQLRQELSEIRQKVGTGPPNAEPGRESSGPEAIPASGTREERPGLETTSRSARLDGAGWHVGAFLENSGLLPIHAQRVVEELRAAHGDRPPLLFGRELELARGFLRDSWRSLKASQPLSAGAHVLVGVPGAGKTVCLCKWLAQMVLVEGRTASVWRLDGRVANMAEVLSVYSQILGTPVERSVPNAAAGGVKPADVLLIDLPGVNSGDPDALGQLRQQLAGLPNPQVHLVLNAAYELPLLLAQVRAFAALPIADLIFTHLDEEPRWGKLWNFVLGTNFTIRLLSAGQNIPGPWIEATPDQILTRHFPGK